MRKDFIFLNYGITVYNNMEVYINSGTYAEIAAFRPGWQTSVHIGIAAYEERMKLKAE